MIGVMSGRTHEGRLDARPHASHRPSVRVPAFQDKFARGGSSHPSSARWQILRHLRYGARWKLLKWEVEWSIRNKWTDGEAEGSTCPTTRKIPIYPHFKPKFVISFTLGRTKGDQRGRKREKPLGEIDFHIFEKLRKNFSQKIRPLSTDSVTNEETYIFVREKIHFQLIKVFINTWLSRVQVDSGSN